MIWWPIFCASIAKTYVADENFKKPLLRFPRWRCNFHEVLQHRVSANRSIFRFRSLARRLKNVFGRIWNFIVQSIKCIDFFPAVKVREQAVAAIKCSAGKYDRSLYNIHVISLSWPPLAWQKHFFFQLFLVCSSENWNNNAPLFYHLREVNDNKSRTLCALLFMKRKSLHLGSMKYTESYIRIRRYSEYRVFFQAHVHIPWKICSHRIHREKKKIIHHRGILKKCSLAPRYNYLIPHVSLDRHTPEPLSNFHPLKKYAQSSSRTRVDSPALRVCTLRKKILKNYYTVFWKITILSYNATTDC